MWTIYLIQHSATGQIYIGLTGNINRRIDQHNHGDTKSTYRRNGKWQLIYCEIYRSKDDAYDRERKLKQHGRAKQELFKRTMNSRY